MASHIPKRERLMNLVAALFAARDPLPFREIVGRVVGYDDAAGEDALEKRFDRDKAELRRLGIPVEYVSGEEAARAGYVISKQRVFQQKVSFSGEEALLLSIAGRLGAAATGGGPLEESLKSALRKLAVDLPDDPLEDLSTVTVLRTRAGDMRALENVALLAEAVASNRRVAFRYRAADRDEETDRKVDPYGLGLRRGAWYLVGFCHLRQAERMFKVSRIHGSVRTSARAEGAEFRVPADFSLESWIGREDWDYGDGEPIVARLRVHPDLVAEGVLQEARLVGTDHGLSLMELPVRRLSALVTWVISRAGEVEVLAPEELRRQVAVEARRVLIGLEEQVAPKAVAAPGTTADNQGANAAPGGE